VKANPTLEAKKVALQAEREAKESAAKAEQEARELEKQESLAAERAELVASYTGGAVTLKLVTAANPTMSIQEAIQKMSLINSAVGNGLKPLPLVGNLYNTLPQGATVESMAIPQPAPVIRNHPPEHVSNRVHREIYIGNVPLGTTEAYLRESLSLALKSLGHASDPTLDCCVLTRITEGKTFAFAQFLSNEDASAAVAFLNGMTVGTEALRIARPKGWVSPTLFDGQTRYNASNALLTAGGIDVRTAHSTSMQPQQQPMALPLPPLRAAAAAIAPTAPVAVSTVLSISGVPAHLSELEIRGMLNPYGKLQAFKCVHIANAASKTATFEFTNKEEANAAMQALVNTNLGLGLLQVQSINEAHAAVLLTSSSHPEQFAEQALAALAPTCVIRLLNIVTDEDLKDEHAHEELLEDITDECTIHGTVDKIVIPTTGEGVGAVFVQFSAPEGAAAALKAWSKKIMGKIRIKGTFYPVELFDESVFQYREQL